MDIGEEGFYALVEEALAAEVSGEAEKEAKEDDK